MRKLSLYYCLSCDNGRELTSGRLNRRDIQVLLDLWRKIRKFGLIRFFQDGIVIDEDGYRPNVGIILCNSQGDVLWARRIGQDAWQFPQGGIKDDESPEDALYRELAEEVGLKRQNVEVLGSTRGWLRYRLPRRMIRYNSKPVCVGQKQKWYLLQLISDDEQINVNATDKPEFDGWCWSSYWFPLGQVVSFKRDVYRRALKELAPRIMRLQRSSERQDEQ